MGGTMSVKFRRWLMIAGAVTWAGWLSASWVTLNADHKMAPMHLLGQEVLMLGAMTITVACIVGSAIAPLVATVKIWLSIGQRMQCQSCECGDVRKRAVGAVVIPIRPIRSNTFSDS